MNWLILYDIRDARRLQQVEKIVSSYAWRVQKSVFESDAPEATIEKMKRRLNYTVDEKEDFISVLRFFVTIVYKINYRSKSNEND